MRLTRIALIMALATAAPAEAANATFNGTLPFKLQLGKIEEVEMGGLTYTVVAATITNGAHFLNDVEIHCEARNAKGYTWDVTGEVALVAPEAKRTFKLLSSSGDDTGEFAKPTKVSCAVKSFTIPLM